MVNKELKTVWIAATFSVSLEWPLLAGLTVYSTPCLSLEFQIKHCHQSLPSSSSSSSLLSSSCHIHHHHHHHCCHHQHHHHQYHYEHLFVTIILINLIVIILFIYWLFQLFDSCQHQHFHIHILVSLWCSNVCFLSCILHFHSSITFSLTKLEALSQAGKTSNSEEMAKWRLKDQVKEI